MGAGLVDAQRTGRRRRGRNHAPLAEINVTPFVDVMLVLLIIFMVTAPLLVVGIPVELPKTAASPLASEREAPLTVTLQADGGIAIQTTPVTAEELVPKLQAIAEERQSQRIYLRADGQITYGQVAQVMGVLSAAGFPEISLVTDTRDPTLGDASAPGDAAAAEGAEGAEDAGGSDSPAGENSGG
ncbi:MAG: protein TolR [Rhodobacteraceae bacterium]|nr:protein TolR [Paracoccaceae bacterium]